jgi:hypothetical protein
MDADDVDALCRSPDCGCEQNRQGSLLRLLTPDCAICLLPYGETHGVTSVAVIRHCFHVFHHDCLSEMLHHTGCTLRTTSEDLFHCVVPQDVTRPKCPLCRRDIGAVLRSYLVGMRRAQEQFASMRDKLVRGRLACVRSGVPDERIVYVVRNNASADDSFDRQGDMFVSIEDAIDVCRLVLTAMHVYGANLYDIHVIDARHLERVSMLIDDVEDEDLARIPLTRRGARERKATQRYAPDSTA